MSRWVEALTRMPLAEAGQVLDEASRISLASELTAALRVDVPMLKHLRASELVTAELVLDNRLWLVFQVAESTRQQLEPGESLRRRFQQEVQTARSQLETVEWRIRDAIGEGRAPGDEVQDSEEASSTRAIRERVRRHERGGQLLIPGIPEARQIEIGPVPSALARGPRVEISVEVVSMTRKRAKLRNVVAAPGHEGCANQIPGFFDCDELDRDLGRDHGSKGEVLRQAMDGNRRVELLVTVVLDWATGTAVRFEQS